MTTTIRHHDPLGRDDLTLYVKPYPLSNDPSWDDDVVSMSHNLAGEYSASVSDPASSYAVFEQAGEDPSQSDDEMVATIQVVAQQSTLEAVQTEVEKVPRQGETYRHKRVAADENEQSADVVIEEVPE